MGKCYNSVTISAPSDQVWNAIRDFHDMSWAEGVITDVEKVGDADGVTPGAGRILNGAFHETLLSVDDEEMTISYSIDDGPEPLSKDSVQSYFGAVKVHTVTLDNTTFLEWRSTYESSDDQAVGEFCNPIYQALLAAMKDYF